jgi:ATP-dependent RNA helicase MSS116
VLAKAKTGTGKTLAFLIPTIERMAHFPRQQRGDIRAIVLSPARELAMQTAREAEALLTFFPGSKVACMVCAGSPWCTSSALVLDLRKPPAAG